MNKTRVVDAPEATDGPMEDLRDRLCALVREWEAAGKRGGVTRSGPYYRCAQNLRDVIGMEED